MTHPEELLAEYVDGSLAEPRRVEVEDHLAVCSRCREETDLARAASAALVALPEEPVPFGVMNPVAAELRDRRERDRVPWYARLRWAAGVAVAAALVGLLAVVLPRLGGVGTNGGGGQAAMSPGSSGNALRAPSSSFGAVFQDQPHMNYGAAGLEALAREVAAHALAGPTTIPSVTPAPDQAVGEGLGSGFASLQPPVAARAQACVSRAVRPPGTDRLVRLIRARYEGTPAFLSVYLESGGPGEPATKVVIWVVARSDCRILSFASRRL
ncbi:MAG TPA: zf-HC2 domain-containing protein [Actinomycetota bacterium]|nr:zf-HC2 domain-containing protein [Actinomycetota bacterium]